MLAPSFVNYRANIYALKDLDIRTIVSWSETRAISHNYKIGEYVIVDDLIDATVRRGLWTQSCADHYDCNPLWNKELCVFFRTQKKFAIRRIRPILTDVNGRWRSPEAAADGAYPASARYR